MGVVAESEWRGGEQKKLEFCKVDMPSNSNRAVALASYTNDEF